MMGQKKPVCVGCGGVGEDEEHECMRGLVAMASGATICAGCVRGAACGWAKIARGAALEDAPTNPRGGDGAA